MSKSSVPVSERGFICILDSVIFDSKFRKLNFPDRNLDFGHKQFIHFRSARLSLDSSSTMRLQLVLTAPQLERLFRSSFLKIACETFFSRPRLSNSDKISILSVFECRLFLALFSFFFIFSFDTWSVSCCKMVETISFWWIFESKSHPFSTLSSIPLEIGLLPVFSIFFGLLLFFAFFFRMTVDHWSLFSEKKSKSLKTLRRDDVRHPCG